MRREELWSRMKLSHLPDPDGAFLPLVLRVRHLLKPLDSTSESHSSHNSFDRTIE